MSLSKFLNPCNDVAFKKIFGSEKNKDILIHFLNDMLVFKEKRPIVDVSFLKTVQDPDIAARKTSIVDVLCQDDNGHLYVVEMQVARSRGFEKRAQYYAAKAYVSQMHEGEQYEGLKEVIFLAIVDFSMFPDKQAYKSDHVILDRESYEHDLKDFSFTFLELAKFKKGSEELTTMVDKWAYYFKHADETREEEVGTIFAHDMIIQRAYEELNRFGWNEQELTDYEAVIKKERDYQAVIDQKFHDGLTKGREEGREEEKLDTVRRMIAAGLDNEMIARISNSTIAEIEHIRTAKMD